MKLAMGFSLRDKQESMKEASKGDGSPLHEPCTKELSTRRSKQWERASSEGGGDVGLNVNAVTENVL